MDEQVPPSDLTASLIGDARIDPSATVVLWNRARSGDRKALEDLMVHYEERLLRIVRIRMWPTVRSRYESMDIVQLTYQTAMRKLDGFEARDPASFLSWLTTIATNQIRDAADRIRTDGRNPDHEIPLDGKDSEALGAMLPASSKDSVSEKVWRAELREMLDRAVAELPDDYKNVVVLRDYCEENWDRITAALGKPTQQAARQLHQRAWMQLRRQLAPKLKGIAF